MARSIVVAVFLLACQANPEVVTERLVRSDVKVIERSFDGVDVLATRKSIFKDGEWQVREHRQLQSPQRVERARVISDERAALTLAWQDDYDAHGLITRLVHLPFYAELPLRQPVRNSSDVQPVISHFALAWEVRNERIKRVGYVDAYSGEVLRQASTVHSTGISAVGNLYTTPFQLDVSPITGSPGQYLLEDPNRTTRLDSGGNPLPGISVVDTFADGVTPKPSTSLHYTPGAWSSDAMLGVTQAWDFFLLNFQRRGLKNLQPTNAAADWAVNDVMVFQTNVPGLCAYADQGTALIGISDPNRCSTLHVLGHETTHHVFFTDADLSQNENDYFNPEDSGIDEGNADFFGALVRARGMAVLAAPIGTSIPPLVSPEITRLCPEPSHSEGIPGQGLTSWQPGLAYSTIDEHYVGNILWHADCLLAMGAPVLGSAEDPNRQSVYLPNGFTGLGLPQTTDIAYAAMAQLGPVARPYTFQNVRDAYLAAGLTLYGGPNNTQSKAIEDAFAAVNVGMPANRTVPIITFTQTYLADDVPLQATIVDPDGLGKVLFRLDGALLASLTQPPYEVTPPRGLIPGSLHTLTITAYDNFANQATATYFLTVDAQSPQVTVFSNNAANKYLAQTTRSMHLTGSDDFGIVSARIDLNQSGVWTTVWSTTYSPAQALIDQTVNFAVPWLPNGNYTLRVTLTDNVGQQGSLNSPLYWDAALPETCRFEPQYPVISRQHPELVVRGIDSVSPIKEYRVIWQGTDLGTKGSSPVWGAGYSAPFSAPLGSSVGTHAATVQCTDEAVYTATTNATVIVEDEATAFINFFVGQAPGSLTFGLNAKDNVRHIYHWTARMQCTQSGSHTIALPVVQNQINANYQTTQTGLINGESCTVSLDVMNGVQLWTHVSKTAVIASPTEQACLTTHYGGGLLGDQGDINVGAMSGHLKMYRDTFVIPDQISLRCSGTGNIGGVSNFSPGCEGTNGWVPTQELSFSCSSSIVHWQVVGNCTGDPEGVTTEWTFHLGCAY